MKPMIGMACWPTPTQAKSLPVDPHDTVLDSFAEQQPTITPLPKQALDIDNEWCLDHKSINTDAGICLDDIPFDFDLINCTDSQLEQVIFQQCPIISSSTDHNNNDNDDFCHGFGNLSFDGIESLLKKEDFEFLNIKPSQDLCSPDIGPFSPSSLPATFDDDEFEDDDQSKQQSPIISESPTTISSIEEFQAQINSSPNPLPHSLDVANYEEVCTSIAFQNGNQQQSSTIISLVDEKTDPEQTHLDFLNQCCEQQQTQLDDDDHLSLASSYMTMTTTVSSPYKRKSTVDEDGDHKPVTMTRKRRRTTKRILDDRIKYQNKVAAMRYRQKKREEKCHIDDLFAIEQRRHDRLSNRVEELTVQINVLKELLAKYLSPKLLNSQMQILA
ncbi:LOW QUALITY PROTEIN: uncharacterized protein LOC113793924 [Dermatophagoides pteronyssinus]|uniref:LOW QUALITY PROTEIN: uncharacterized protein LOC113793924 n=1 Tax=Dermatophagoides pteronyssinus TaxID=6956 RepID=UPI003F671CA3